MPIYCTSCKTLYQAWCPPLFLRLCTIINSYQGRIQELKGGGGEVKYAHARKFHPWPCPLWCINGYTKLRGGKLGEAQSRSRLHTRGLGCFLHAERGRKIVCIRIYQPKKNFCRTNTQILQDFAHFCRTPPPPTIFLAHKERIIIQSSKFIKFQKKAGHLG